jgi:5-(carboxyamino)imidazole ribonucleotide synthase
MGRSALSYKIGVLGGGQLGKMLAQSAADWNLSIHVLDPTEPCPASICAVHHKGDFRSYEDVLQFGSAMDLITIEIEQVNLDALRALKKLGKQVFPDPESLAIIQDKGLQKLSYQKWGMPTADFFLLDDWRLLEKRMEVERFDYPIVQKLRKDGYDGRGVQLIHSAQDLSRQFQAPSVIEKKVSIAKEIAVLAARNRSGAVVTYDPVEMVFHPEANLLLYQQTPATIHERQASECRKIAADLIGSLDIVGLLAVEFFVDTTGKIYINEVAPRPHNSGHHTIETCITSQYQQHLRAILNLPLGSPKLLQPSILWNLLGAEGHSGPAFYQGLEDSLSRDGVYIHLYGKEMTKPFRKMGHVTITAPELESAVNQWLEIKEIVRVISIAD